MVINYNLSRQRRLSFLRIGYRNRLTRISWMIAMPDGYIKHREFKPAVIDTDGGFIFWYTFGSPNYKKYSDWVMSGEGYLPWIKSNDDNL